MVLRSTFCLSVISSARRYRAGQYMGGTQILHVEFHPDKVSHVNQLSPFLWFFCLFAAVSILLGRPKCFSTSTSVSILEDSTVNQAVRLLM